MPYRFAVAVLAGLVLACLALSGFAAAADSPRPNAARTGDVVRIAPETLAAMLGRPDVTVIDVRLESDWNASQDKIKGAARESPLRAQVERWAKNYPKNASLVLYCACPRQITSAAVAAMLQDELGFSDVKILDGGWQAWLAAELPTEPK